MTEVELDLFRKLFVEAVELHRDLNMWRLDYGAQPVPADQAIVNAREYLIKVEQKEAQ